MNDIQDMRDQGITALRAHRFLLRCALSLGGVFAWVFIFQYFYELSGDPGRALAGSALMYGLAQFITIVLTPITAAYLRRGVKQSLVWGVMMLAGAYVVLGATLTGLYAANPFGWGIACFAICQGAYRALYWIPYRLQDEELPHTRFPAHVVFEAVVAVLPLFAGLTMISGDLPAERILFGAAALAVLSVIPALALPDIRERFSWDYGYTFAQLFRGKNCILVGHSLLSGVEGGALYHVWPIAAFLVVGLSYPLLGAVFAASLLVILLIRSMYARIQRDTYLRAAPVWRSVAIISGWVGRSAVGTPLGLVVADVFSHTTAPSHGITSDPFVFEQVSERGAFVDEYTALKEIALASGKIISATLVGILALVLPISYALAAVLVCAAIASVFAMFSAKVI